MPPRWPTRFRLPRNRGDFQPDLRAAVDEMRARADALSKPVSGVTISSTPLKLRCSFCGKPHSQVKKLVAGPHGVAICDECIVLCVDILTENHPNTPDSDIPA